MAFRSPGARPSPRVGKQQVVDGPIHDFTVVIQCTVTEDWQKRTSAFQALVAMIPSSSYENGNQNEWYHSAAALRHIAVPVSALLKDSRSTVVKLTCENLSELFSKCKSNARYLFKDLMPTVCQVHACTVQVIRNYVQTMVLETLRKVPCKMAMPVWLDRVKNDKSQTVREACALYLSTSLAEWGASDDDDFENENNGYLSREIYHQVGSILVQKLRDRSPNVRQHCKKGLEVLASQKQDVLDELVNDRSLNVDSRVRKLLKRLQAGETGLGDEVSVSSRMSASSRVSRSSVASAPVLRSSHGRSQPTNASRRVPPRSYRNLRIPTTIGVQKPVGGLGPPMRINGKKSEPVPDKRKAQQKVVPMSPIRHVTSSVTASPVTPRSVTASPGGMALSTPTQKLLDAHPSKNPSTPQTPLEYEIELKKSNDDHDAMNRSFDSQDSDVSVLRPIANAEELRQKAKTRTTGTSSSRRSSILQDRLLRTPQPKTRKNGAGTAATPIMDVAHMSSSEIVNNPHLPIHTKIAYELLEAHKTHIDQIMEILKVEMDALKDFELVILENGPMRPTEEEVLEYFESLGLCLDQRKKAGSILQKKMDRISQG